MNREWRVHGVRFVLLLLVQVLLLRQINPGEGWLRFGEVFIYPLFFMTLPLRMHTAFLCGLAFLAGLLVDQFYDTPGVHAGAAVFSAYLRPLVLRMIEPRAGYDPRQHPTRATFGMPWFLRYVALFLLVHIFLLQVLTVFTFYYFTEILVRTLLSWALSFTVVFLQDLVFNPRQ